MNTNRIRNLVTLSVIVATIFSVSGVSVQAQGGGEPIATPTPSAMDALPTMAAPNSTEPTEPLVYSQPIEVANIKGATQDRKYLDAVHSDTVTKLFPAKKNFGAGIMANPPQYIYTPTVATSGVMSGAAVIDVYSIGFVRQSQWVTVTGISAATNITNRNVTLKAWLENSTKWRNQAGSLPAVTYNIVKNVTVIGSGYDVSKLSARRDNYTGFPGQNKNGNIAGIMDQFDAVAGIIGGLCDRIAHSKNPVQFWIWGDSRSHLPEFAWNGPLFDSGNNDSHLMPWCGRQYAAFGYSWVGESSEGANDWATLGTDQAMHDHGHMWEIYWFNGEFFGYPVVSCKFLNYAELYGNGTVASYPSAPMETGYYTFTVPSCVGGWTLNAFTRMAGRPQPQSLKGYTCGDVHFPLTQLAANDNNPLNEYIYNNTNSILSRCDNWWVSNGSPTSISSTAWGSTPEGWYTYWFQRIPTRSSNTGYEVTTPKMKGWWFYPWILGAPPLSPVY